MPRRALALVAGLIGLSIAAQAHAGWVRTWAAAPEPPTAGFGPFPATPSFEDQTVRQVVRVSAGGGQVRVRLTNEYGAKALRIGAARIALAGPDGTIRPGTDHILKFGGSSSATIPAGAPLVSDPVRMDVHALSSLAVSLYLPEQTGQCSCHQTSMQTLYLADHGDQTGAAKIPGQERPFPGPRVFLSGIDVDAAPAVRTVVLFGDSITDGVGSTSNANHRWPDLFADRLARHHIVLATANQGISGNRVLRDGAAQSALARFDRDVLAVPGAATVVVFEGVNDLGRGYPPPAKPGAPSFGGAPEPVTADEMIAGYRQLIARAHGSGLRVIGATIAPYGGASYWSEQGEAVRAAINAWIRTSRAFDGVIDFDAALRDPANPTQIRAGYHAGDHLHGSDAGYQVMADAIDLSLFTSKPGRHAATKRH